jgi:putative ABC transport system ATP-binding protein
LDTPTKGSVFIEKRDVSKLNENELAQIRRKKIGFVFQFFNLIPTLTALENVALPMRFDGVGKKDAESKAKTFLEKVGLSHRINHKPSELSGGEQQKVAIARALINDPELVLADEPTGNLDTKSGEEVLKILKDLHMKMKKTVVIVTHDPNVAKESKRKIYIKDGKIVKDE